MNFLLIDDDSDEFDIILAAGEKASMPARYTWSYAPSAAAGIEVLNKIQLAAVFIDYNMPVVNGIDCALQIRKNPKFDSVFIVLYSTSITEQMAEAADSAGINFSIKKPDDFVEMSSLIDTVSSFVLARK
ncbi:MAG: response regulator transcription factor [Chitinophagaceae bacterium]|nr:MAG: response regulator transcription factor [Chitinophagaceae bacterium]